MGVWAIAAHQFGKPLLFPSPLSVLQTLGELLQMLLSRGGYLLLFCYGCEMINAGTLDFGILTEALQYRGGMLMGSMMWLNSYAEVRKNSVGLKRMEEIYGTEE